MNELEKSSENLPVTDATTTTALATGISLQDFKSFFYLINAKPDRETKFYQPEKIVSINSIIELNDLIQEKLQNHQIVTSQVTLTVTLTNDRTFDFGTWQTFINEKWHTSAMTKSIFITWDFSVQLSGYKFPQRHTVKLRIGSRLKPKDMFELVMNSEGDNQLMEAFAHAICTVDFINPVISGELFLIVEKWHDALPKNYFTSNVQKYLRKHVKKIEQLIMFLVLTASSMVLYGSGKIFLNKIWVQPFDQPFYIKIFGGLIVSFVFFYFFIELGKIWTNRITKYISNLKTVTLFKITKGDDNACEDIKKKNEGIIKSIGIKFLVTLLFNIIAFIFTKLIVFIELIIK